MRDIENGRNTEFGKPKVAYRNAVTMKVPRRLPSMRRAVVVDAVTVSIRE